MGTDLSTSELLEGLYGAKPTMMILSTQPTINISMEEMNMAISEHSTGSYSLLFPPWGTWPEQVSTTTTAPGDREPSMHFAAQDVCVNGLLGKSHVPSTKTVVAQEGDDG